MLPRLFAAALTLTACAPMPATDADGGPTTPPLTSAEYTLIDDDLGLAGAETLEEAAGTIRARLASAEPGEGNYSETLTAYEDGARGTVVLTMSGLPDDAVETEQHVVEFTLRPDRQVAGRVLVMKDGYGIRQKCRRGANPGVWTNQPCP